MNDYHCVKHQMVSNGRPPIGVQDFLHNLEHFHQSCSAESGIRGTAVFLAFGGVSAQLQGDNVTCAFAEALPTPKNPRGSALHLFCQCSKSTGDFIFWPVSVGIWPAFELIWRAGLIR